MPLKPLSKWGITLFAMISVNAFTQDVAVKISRFFPPTSNAHANILVPWSQRVTRKWVAEMKATNIDAVTLLDDAQRLLAKHAVKAKR